MTRASLVLITALAAGSVAHAQPAPPANAPADAAYQEARRLYDLREWDAAIAKFKEAYRLRPDAPSLFNIAQANRLKGDCVEALSFYRTYKRNFPTEKNIDKVDKFITEMDTCVKEGRSKSTPPPTTTTGTTTTTTGTDTGTSTGTGTGTGTTEPTTTTTTTGTTTPSTGTSAAAAGTSVTTTVTPAPKDGGKKLRVTGLIVGGAGVLSLGASAFFGLRARGAANDAEDGNVGEMWNPAIQSRGESAAKNFKITAIAGGALLVTGTVLYLVGRQSTTESSRVSIVPHADGATVVWGSGF